MILSDRDIKKAIESGKIVVDPRPDFKTQLGSCSVDLKLGNTFRTYNHQNVAVLDPNDKTLLDKITTVMTIEDDQPFVLHPGEFALAVTKEHIEIPDDLTGRLEGRSSIGRLGIVVHSTAATFDAGFRGNAVLELANIGRIPVKLFPGMRICSMSFEQLSSPAETPYYKKKAAKYSGQKKP